jgi:hypothetical protein
MGVVYVMASQRVTYVMASQRVTYWKYLVL